MFENCVLLEIFTVQFLRSTQIRVQTKKAAGKICPPQQIAFLTALIDLSALLTIFKDFSGIPRYMLK